MTPIDPLVEAIVSGVVARLSAMRSPERQTRLMDVEGAAIYLGRTEKAIRKLIDAGKLPVVRIDSRVCLDIRDLDRIIEEAKDRAV